MEASMHVGVPTTSPFSLSRIPEPIKPSTITTPFFLSRISKPSYLTTTPFSLSRIPKPWYLTTTTCHSSKWAHRLFGDFHFNPTTASDAPPSAALLGLLQPRPVPIDADRTIPLPIDFYQVLGAKTHFLADRIRRAYEDRVSNPPQQGFSTEALVGRCQILKAARDTLANATSRGDYNSGLLHDFDSTITTHVPWDKVPGALCVLQEAGESEVVIRVGQSLLLERLPKQFKQDVVLVMTLAYVDLSREAMTVNPPDFVQCCEVLERALKLLQEEGASNLARDLQAQIDETLEEITPRCILELLALPLNDENQMKREEGLHRVRNILWSVGGGGAAAIGGGYTREYFMNEALLRMTAAEQVDLFAAKPSNIIPESSEVYSVALALIAQAFVGKKPHLIRDADRLFEQLQQTKASSLDAVSDFTKRTDRKIDFALERGLCSLLVGDVDDCRFRLGIDSESSPYVDPFIIEFVMDNSEIDNDNDLLPGLCKLLETWLMEVVFPRFRDTQDLYAKLGDYYDDPTVLSYLERMEGRGSSPLAAAAAIVKIGAKATAALGNVKLSALQALRGVFPLGKREEGASTEEYDGPDSILEMQKEDSSLETDQYNSVIHSEASGNPDLEDSGELDFTYKIKDASVKIMCASMAVGLLTLLGLKYIPRRSGLAAARKELGSAMPANVVNLDVPVDEKLIQEMPKMDARLAETLVCKWQEVKSQALGRHHCLAELSEVLEGRMLKTWTDRATEIAGRGWFWEYTPLSMTIESVTVSSDGMRATVEATIEEAACLTDPADPQHDDSYSTTYTTRYEMACSNAGWKITEGAVLKS